MLSPGSRRHIALSGLAIAVGFAVGTRGLPSALAIATAVLIVIAIGQGLSTLVLGYVAARPLVDVFIRAEIAGFSPGQLWALGLIVLTMAWGLSVREHGAHNWWGLGMFAVLYTVLAVARGDSYAGLMRGARIMSWALLVPVVADAMRIGLSRKLIMRAGYAFAVVACGVAGYSVLTGRYGAAYYTQYSALTREYQAPHAIATMLVCGAPFVIERLVKSHGKTRALHGLVLGIAATLTLLSMVRSAILAFWLLVTVVALGVFRRGSLRQRAIVAGVMIVLLVSWVIAGEYAVGRLVALLSEYSYGGGVGSGRSVFWFALVNEITASPSRLLFGAGGGADQVIIATTTGMRVGAHNDLLELVAVGGVLLATSYLAFLYGPFRAALKIVRTHSPGSEWEGSLVFLAAMASFLFLAVTNGVMGYQGSVAFGLYAGMTLGMLSQQEASS